MLSDCPTGFLSKLKIIKRILSTMCSLALRESYKQYFLIHITNCVLLGAAERGLLSLLDLL